MSKQAFSHDRCNIFPGFTYKKADNTFLNSVRKQAGTKVGPDQLGPPVLVGSTRIDSDQLGSNKKRQK